MSGVEKCDDFKEIQNTQLIGEIEKLLKDYECKYVSAETLLQTINRASDGDNAVPALRELEDLAEYLYTELQNHFRPIISCSGHSCRGL
jgi:hypothetical protein